MKKIFTLLFILFVTASIQAEEPIVKWTSKDDFQPFDSEEQPISALALCNEEGLYSILPSVVKNLGIEYFFKNYGTLEQPLKTPFTIYFVFFFKNTNQVYITRYEDGCYVFKEYIIY